MLVQNIATKNDLTPISSITQLAIIFGVILRLLVERSDMSIDDRNIYECLVTIGAVSEIGCEFVCEGPWLDLFFRVQEAEAERSKKAELR